MIQILLILLVLSQLLPPGLASMATVVAGLIGVYGLVVIVTHFDVLKGGFSMFRHPIIGVYALYAGYVLLSYTWLHIVDTTMARILFSKVISDGVAGLLLIIVIWHQRHRNPTRVILWTLIAGTALLYLIIILKGGLNFTAGNRLNDDLSGPTYIGQLGGLSALAALYLSRLTTRKKLKIVCLILYFVNFMFVILTISKLTLVALIVGSAMMVKLTDEDSRYRKLYALGFGLILIWGLFYSYGYFHDYFLGTDNASTSAKTFTGRDEIWFVALQGFLASPWWGNGVGAIAQVLGYTVVHNEVFHILYHYGVIGLCFWLAINGLLIREGVRLLRIRNSSYSRLNGALLLALVVFYLIKGTGESNTGFMLFRPWLIALASSWFIFENKIWFRQRPQTESAFFKQQSQKIFRLGP